MKLRRIQNGDTNIFKFGNVRAVYHDIGIHTLELGCLDLLLISVRLDNLGAIKIALVDVTFDQRLRYLLMQRKDVFARVEAEDGVTGDQRSLDL